VSRAASRALTAGLAPSRLAAEWDDVVIVAATTGSCDASAVTGSIAAIALIDGLDAVMAQPSLGTLPSRANRAIVVGTQSAALHDVTRFLTEVDRLGAHLANVGLFPMTVMNAAAGLAAIRYGCEGPNVTLHGGPAVAFDAVIMSADMVASGLTHLAFAGGFEIVERDGRLTAVHALLAITTVDRARAAGARPLARLLGSRAAEPRTKDDAADVLFTLGGAVRAVGLASRVAAAATTVTHRSSAVSLVLGPASLV
jgi:hypothetical protein